jgi:hypothetical protein
MSYRKRMRKMKQLAEKILPLDKKSQLYINGNIKLNKILSKFGNRNKALGELRINE